MVAMNLPVPEGAASGLTYLIEYEEDLWLALPLETQEFCKEQWLSKARTTPGVRHVVLRLLPDDLFPLHGNEKPYVGWQEAIDGPPARGFTLAGQVRITLTGDFTPVIRSAISKAIRDYPIGTPYEIIGHSGHLIERGKR